MRLTLEQKMKMCEEHVIKGKSISDASEMYGGYDIGNLKYLINIYKRYGSLKKVIYQGKFYLGIKVLQEIKLKIYIIVQTAML